MEYLLKRPEGCIVFLLTYLPSVRVDVKNNDPILDFCEQFIFSFIFLLVSGVQSNSLLSSEYFMVSICK